MRRINWRYAIGELIIITIGISLAFTLNRWAAEQADAKKSQSYMSNLIAELKQDIVTLDSNIAEIERRMKFMNEFVPHLHRDLPGRDKMANGLYAMIDPVAFRANGTTWQSLKYSGDIQLINDLEKRNMIIRHYESYSVVKEEYNRHYNFSKDYMAPYFMGKVNYVTMAAENYPHLKDNYFLNLIYALRGIYQNELQAHTKARDSAKKLIENLKSGQRNSA